MQFANEDGDIHADEELHASAAAVAVDVEELSKAETYVSAGYLLMKGRRHYTDP